AGTDPRDTETAIRAIHLWHNRLYEEDLSCQRGPPARGQGRLRREHGHRHDPAWPRGADSARRLPAASRAARRRAGRARGAPEARAPRDAQTHGRMIVLVDTSIW